MLDSEKVGVCLFADIFVGAINSFFGEGGRCFEATGSQLEPQIII